MDDDGREQEMAVGRLERGKKKLQRVMNKSVRRWMIVIYKQALVLIRQAFKMVTDLEKNAGDVVGNSYNSVIRDLIEKTRNWLVHQMGKKFSSGKHGDHFLSAPGRGGRGKKKVCSSSSSSSAVVAAADDDDASSPPPPSPSPSQ